MMSPRRIALAFLVLAAFRAPCQEAPAAGKSVEIAFGMAGLQPSVLRIRAGLDIARFLGLGVLWGMGFNDPGITDLEAGVWCTAALLSEGEMGLPVSFLVTGSFAKVRSMGGSLEQEDLMRSGTTALLGAELSRTFGISERLGLLAAIEGSYRFSTMTTEAIAGSGSTFETLIVPEAQFAGSVRVGLSVVVAEHIRMLFALAVGLNGNLVVSYGPSVALLSQ